MKLNPIMKSARRYVKRYLHIYFVCALFFLAAQWFWPKAHQGAGAIYPWMKNLSGSLYAQATNIKAVLFVIGNTCPPGFLDAAAAGLPDLEGNRFPLMVPDTNGNSSGDPQLNNVVGGNAVMTVAQMPRHNHAFSYAFMYVGAGGNGALGQVGSMTTNDAGSDQPYWQPYYKVKPCIWTVN